MTEVPINHEQKPIASDKAEAGLEPLAQPDVDRDSQSHLEYLIKENFNSLSLKIDKLELLFLNKLGYPADNYKNRSENEFGVGKAPHEIQEDIKTQSPDNAKLGTDE